MLKNTEINVDVKATTIAESFNLNAGDVSGLLRSVAIGEIPAVGDLPYVDQRALGLHAILASLALPLADLDAFVKTAPIAVSEMAANLESLPASELTEIAAYLTGAASLHKLLPRRDDQGVFNARDAMIISKVDMIGEFWQTKKGIPPVNGLVEVVDRGLYIEVGSDLDFVARVLQATDETITLAEISDAVEAIYFTDDEGVAF